MLGKHLFLPFHEIFVLSHLGNEDSCYGKIEKKSQWSWHCKHRHSSSSNNYGFSPERLQFSRRLYKQTVRRKERACKACSLKFQSSREAPRVINKMAEKNIFIVEEACQFPVTMTRPEKDWGASVSVL